MGAGEKGREEQEGEEWRREDREKTQRPPRATCKRGISGENTSVRHLGSFQAVNLKQTAKKEGRAHEHFFGVDELHPLQSFSKD